MPVAGPTAPPISPATAAIAAFRAAAERGDADAVGELLAPEVVFHSPMTTRARFEGKAEVTALHRDIFAVLEVLDTSDPLERGDTWAFTFRARVRGVDGEAVLLACVDEQGRIVEITIFARPLPTLATLFAALPPRVSTRRRGRLRGTLAAILTRPLAVVLRTADRAVPWFL